MEGNKVADILEDESTIKTKITVTKKKSRMQKKKTVINDDLGTVIEDLEESVADSQINSRTPEK